MWHLIGLEDLALERVEELRRQGDRVRFLRTLPCNEVGIRRGVRATASLVTRILSTSELPVFSSGLPEMVDDVCYEA